jgi:hypothetical protein
MKINITHTYIILMMFASCSDERAIFYEYNGVTITRVDNGNQNYFYYGRFDKGIYPENPLKSDYSGLNSGMQAYLIFKPNNEVEVLNIMGAFDDQKASNFLRLKVNKNEEFIFFDWKDSIDNINGSYDNVIEVHSILKIEQERNKKNQSKVKVLYP